MAKRNKQQVSSKSQKLKRNIIWFSLIILFMKFLVIFSIPNGGWLGADGESYLKGADALLNDGFFSKDSILNYWPAGYSILIWLFSFISTSKLAIVISIFQTVVFAYAVMFFVSTLRTTRLSKLVIPTILLLSLNPTLSLSSLVVGYESLVASCSLISIALIVRYQQDQSRKNLIKTVIWVGLLQGFSGFMQPRGLLIGFFIFLIWGLSQNSWKTLIAILLAGSCLMMILPLGLVFRNIEAGNGVIISRNLGITMSVGAGDKATGGYGNSGGVPCSPKTSSASVSDGQLVKCVLTWYFQNPVKAAKLAVNKTLFFWSPWSGPLANGTMNRNPWLKIDPVIQIASNTQGHNLVYGWVGKLISWLWLLGGLFLLLFGFWWLWRLGGLEKWIAGLTGAPVILAWLTALGTIGDHRFRIPTLGLSLFLQVAGFLALRGRFLTDSSALTLEPKGRAR
ncbi:MAG: hypothetical protein Q8L08_11195 [Candidatus Nanopelagicaceae bacterium]|nr:hypothetical protein [Candidatus Nanopelagicaceae bacterium]